MADVGRKEATEREAIAEAVIRMSPEACARVLERTPKGDPLETARVAGIMGAKRTPDLLPFCHPVALTAVEVAAEADADAGTIRFECTVRARDRTGVEMEALTGAAVAALSLYDTAKPYDRGAVISPVRLLSKRGGKSGDYRAPGAG